MRFMNFIDVAISTIFTLFLQWLKINHHVKFVVKESLTDLPESYPHSFPQKL